jgi:hypothetical protein
MYEIIDGKIVLDEHYSDCERGNILITHEGENWHNAYFRFGNEFWLEITYRPCNYPSLNVSVIKLDDKKLAEHINKEFGNGLWIAQKMNIAGVNVNKDGYIIKGN